VENTKLKATVEETCSLTFTAGTEMWRYDWDFGWPYHHITSPTSRWKDRFLNI